MTWRAYVASSWRNEVHHRRVVEQLRADRLDVYDFRNPPDGAGFGWEQTHAGKPHRPATLMETLNDPVARAGFRSDMDALKAADLVVLVMPAGISASLELGYACGAHKRTIIYLPDEAYDDRPFEPELMWLMANAVCSDWASFQDALADALASLLLEETARW